MSTPGRRATATALTLRQLTLCDQVLSPSRSREPACTGSSMPTERHPARHAERVARAWTDDHGVGHGRLDLARVFGALHARAGAIALWEHEFGEAVDKYRLSEGSSGRTSPPCTG
jgi:hypothetical protein